MESLIKSLADLLLVGGTVGGYAMVTVIMLIVGYFKYLKPFLSDFEEMKYNIEDHTQSHNRIISLGQDIKDNIEKSTKKVTDLNSKILDKVLTENKENHVDSINLFKGLNRDIGNLLKILERLEIKTEENHKNVMIEIAKLQTRLEYFNQSGVRGLQK